MIHSCVFFVQQVPVVVYFTKRTLCSDTMYLTLYITLSVIVAVYSMATAKSLMIRIIAFAVVVISVIAIDSIHGIESTAKSLYQAHVEKRLSIK